MRRKIVVAAVVAAVAVALQVGGVATAEDVDGTAEVVADLPAAIAETEQANLAHYQSVLAQNPTDNVTCGPLDGRLAAGTPFVYKSPLIVEPTDVAWVESDCVSRDVTSPEYTHEVRITFEYRKDGEWLTVIGSDRKCSKPSLLRQSVWADCTNRFTYPAFPTAHPAIDLPHRAKFELVSPDKGFAPAYSNVFYPKSAVVAFP